MLVISGCECGKTLTFFLLLGFFSLFLALNTWLNIASTSPDGLIEFSNSGQPKPLLGYLAKPELRPFVHAGHYVKRTRWFHSALHLMRKSDCCNIDLSIDARKERYSCSKGCFREYAAKKCTERGVICDNTIF